MGLFDFLKKKSRVQEKEQQPPTLTKNRETDDTVAEKQQAASAVVQNQHVNSAITEIKQASAVAAEKPASAPELTPEEYGKLAIERLIEETKIPFLRGKLLDNNPTIFESKVGGTPYLPGKEEVPRDKSGRQMQLLAQINCEDLKGLEDYPHEGILQFWLTTNPMWDEFAAKYYPEIDKSITREAVLARLEDSSKEERYSFPVEGEHGMEFNLKEESMSRDDDRLMALFCQYYTELADDWISCPEDAGDEVYEMFEAYCDDSYGGGHKVGGYCSISQLPDYFSYKKDAAPMDVKSDDSEVLLFQLDSESRESVMWGDLGVGTFFIKRKDLKARNMDAVYFSWDCS